MHRTLHTATHGNIVTKQDMSITSLTQLSVVHSEHSFVLVAPTIWNTLPLDICSSSSLCCFRRQLKTFFYNLAFTPS